MSEQVGSLMFLTTHKTLTRKQRAALVSAQPSELPSLAESMGVKVVVSEEVMDAGIHSDIRPRDRMDLLPTLTLMLEEQRKTSQLLLMLIEAMGEEDSDPDADPQTYMDGSPVAPPFTEFVGRR